MSWTHGISRPASAVLALCVLCALLVCGATIEGTAPDQWIKYTPDIEIPPYVGGDVLAYIITDGEGGYDVAIVYITIENHAPVAVDDSAATDEDTAIDIDVLDNDTDEDDDPLTASLPSATTLYGAAVTMNPDGTVHYDPTGSSTLNALAVGESLDDTFSYTVDDGFGGTDTGTVTVHVDGVNDPPVAVDDEYTIAEGATLTVPATGVLGNDSDPDVNGTPPDDTISVDSHDDTSRDGGTVIVNTDGSFTYTPPDPDYYNKDDYGLDD
ncbi:MAG: Ig-like domain-containing protein, partial [Planctomycetota bacterium]|nr:Ig-like domain-containing protein [Planctomycetota bacterium]